MILLDTNILTCIKQTAHPDYAKVTKRLIDYVTADEELVICPQVLYEFYVVATRPVNANGLDLSSEEAVKEVQQFQQAYSFVDDPAELFHGWRGLVKKYGTKGLPAYDTKIVAFMQAQRIKQIYTLNPTDFKRYYDIITVLN